MSDLLKGKQMANGEKCNRPSKTWSLSDQCTAEEYARAHGYTKADGACPAAHLPTGPPPTERVTTLPPQGNLTRTRLSTTP